MNKVATLLNQVGEYLGTPAPDLYDNSVFRERFQEGKTEFPKPPEAERFASFEDLQDCYRGFQDGYRRAQQNGRRDTTHYASSVAQHNEQIEES